MSTTLNERYIIGEDARLRAFFVAEDGVTPIAATGVRIIVRDPRGVVTEYTGGQVATDGLGRFFVDYRVERPGRHYWRADCTGPSAGVAETHFTGYRSNVLT